MQDFEEMSKSYMNYLGRIASVIGQEINSFLIVILLCIHLLIYFEKNRIFEYLYNKNILKTIKDTS